MLREINGVLLYQHRKAQQLTLDKLSRASGLSYQALTLYEAHAHTACEPVALAKLMTTLHCSETALLYDPTDGAITARVETFFDKIERNGISLTEVLKRALHPQSKEPMRFRTRVLCDLLARNYNNMALQSNAKEIYTIIFDSHLCASDLELLHHPNQAARIAILPTLIGEIEGLAPMQKSQMLALLSSSGASVDTLIRIYGYLLDGLYNFQNQTAVHSTFATICDLLDAKEPPSRYQLDEFCYAVSLILLNYSILQRRFASPGIKTTLQKQLF